MTPGMWSSYLIELSPEEMVQTFAAKDWLRLELSDEHAEMLLQRPDPFATGEAFKKFAADNGVAFPQGHLWLTCDIAGHNQAEVIDILKRWLDMFVALDIRAAVLHAGGEELIENGCEPGRLMELRLRALNALTDHIKGTETVICLENVPKVSSEVDDLCSIIEASGSEHLGICLDTGHLNMASADQAGFIGKAGGLLKAVHVADNDGSDDQHLMPYGWGTVAWNDVISGLKEIHYEGLFNFEIGGEIKCPLPVRLAKLDYLKTIVHLMLDGTRLE